MGIGALLGRTAELAALEAALGEACAGRGRLLLLVGEPGIGKTRLADELAARAREARVLWGRCWEAGGAPAYWPWIEVLRPLFEVGEATALATELGPAAAALAAIVPELRHRLPGLPAGAPEDSPHARFLLYDAITRFLRAAGEQTPLVLVLDDLHVADQPTLRLLEFVARSLRSSRILLVGAYRPAEARQSPERGALMANIEREGERLELRRLGHEEVAALISAAGAAGDAGLVEAVMRATEGTPLYVNEVVRLVLADREVGRDLRGRVLVPDGLQAAIRGHLARVSDQTRFALQRAAVIGREFSLTLLQAALDAEDEARAGGVPLPELLVEAERAGLIADQHEHPPRFRFSHILIRETIYRDLGATQRARLHGAVTRALEAGGAASRNDQLTELAHHAALAGDSFPRERSVFHIRRAGERALATYAHEEAGALFLRALGVLEAGDAQADAERADLYLALAETCRRSGERVSAREAVLHAVECARRTGDRARLARAALALGADFSFGVVDETLVGLLEEALAAVPNEPTALRARLLARVAAARQPAIDPDHPIALAREAIALARQVGDRVALAAVLRDARAAYLPMDSLEERTALDFEALALAYEADDKAAILHAQRRLCGDRLEEGNVAAALGHLERYERLAEEMRQPHLRLTSLFIRSSVHALLGEFSAGEELWAEIDRLAAASQDAGVNFMVSVHRLGFLSATQRLDEMARLLGDLDDSLAACPQPDAQLVQAAARVRMGEPGRVPEVMQQFPSERAHPRFGGQHLAAEIAMANGDRVMAMTVYERLLPWAPRYIGFLGCCEGSYSHILARLAEWLGRPADARRLFEDAIALNRRIGARPWMALAQADYAELLRATGHDDDHQRAAALQAEARATAKALGMPGLLARLGEPPAHAAGILAASPVAAGPAESPPVLDLEGEYWTVTFSGDRSRHRDSKGMRMLAHLIGNAGREFHVLHLVGVASGNEGAGILIEDAAAATPDDRARQSYRERLADLQDRLTEAETNGDLGRQECLREELDLLTDEVARGVGLGGRERKTGSSAERARVNVQRRLSDSIRKIAASNPALGRHLDHHVHTGAYCVYRRD
jgi:tetratricopeptide (TPR) repeat protein